MKTNAKNLKISSPERLKELATCSVCLELLKQPRMLPCQHTYCLPCVQNLALRNPKEPPRIRCAQCRAVTLIPKGGVEAFPGNICLQSILDLIGNHCSKDEDDFQHCSGCEIVCDLTFCQHCRRSFCHICTQRHLEDLEDQLQSIYEQLEAAKGRIHDRVKSFLDSTGQVKEDIRQEIQKRIQELRETETRLYQEVENICDQERARSCELSHRLQSNAARVQELISNDFEQASNAPEKVAMFLGMRNECSDVLMSVDAGSSTSILFSEKSLEVTSESRSMPNVGVNGTRTPHPNDVREASISGTPSCSERNDEPKTSDAHSLFYRSRHFLAKLRFGNAFMRRPTGVAVSPWSNELYAVSTDTNTVFVFDMNQGKCLRYFGIRGHRLGEFLCPYGIALSSVTKEIVITDKWKHCIHVFSQSEDFIRQIGTQGSGPSQFRGPESICIDQQGRIYVCDTCNKRVQVLGKDFTFLKEIDGTVLVSETGLAKRCIFQEPSGIAVSSDGHHRIVICDFGNHRVHVFSEEGALLQTFGQKGSLRGQFNKPECVAIDNKGFIFVGDSGNGRVQIFRPDGRFVRAFGNKGTSPRHFNWISGLAITANYDIVISDFKNHIVQVC